MTDRIIVGKRNAGEWGLWVSRPGLSVWSTNVDDFLLTPAMAITLPHMIGYAASNATITHGLGYVPAVHIGVGPDDAPDSWEISSTSLKVVANGSFIVPYIVWPIQVA